MYVIVQGLPINVGAIIDKEIKECAMKKHKTTALLIPSLITSICVVFGVRVTTHDERIKNESVITTRIIERIFGESAVAPLEPAVVVWARRVFEVERRIQELSDNITQCAEAQWRENNRFWTYLQHLEDHLHQFAIYIKNTNNNFLDVLLQQFNFGTLTTDAPAKESEDTQAE